MEFLGIVVGVSMALCILATIWYKRLNKSGITATSIASAASSTEKNEEVVVVSENANNTYITNNWCSRNFRFVYQ